jgi:tRNA(Ile)-lysidine synthase
LEIERQICTARHDRSPCIEVGSSRIELHGDAVLLFASAPFPIAPAEEYEWIPGRGALQLSHGRLWGQQCAGGGLLGDAPVTVRMRRGGERCKPRGRARSQTLKRLLQAYRVPEWRRHGLPLLYRGSELVAVADLWVCAEHAAQAGERGWVMQWQPARQPLPSTGIC